MGGGCGAAKHHTFVPCRPGAFQNPVLGGGRATLPAGLISNLQGPLLSEGAKASVSSGPQAPAAHLRVSFSLQGAAATRASSREGSQGGSGPQEFQVYTHPDRWSFGNKEATSGPSESRSPRFRPAPDPAMRPPLSWDGSWAPGTEAGSGLAPAVGPPEAHGPQPCPLHSRRTTHTLGDPSLPAVLPLLKMPFPLTPQ